MAPTQSDIHTLFTNLSSPSTQPEFFSRVSPTVNWWLLGSTAMSGTYDTLAAFQNATLEILNKKVLGGPLAFQVVHVSGGGEKNEWATVEMEAIDAKCKNGMEYPMRYCWVVRFEKGKDGEEEKIVQVRAYIDTDLLRRAMEGNQ